LQGLCTCTVRRRNINERIAEQMQSSTAYRLS
jgi:hypothetical protein